MTESKVHDPGGKVRLPLLPGVDGDAEFSDDGIYRHWLHRNWGFRRYTDGREPYMLWIGANPSTAEARIDDPTIRKEMAFTKRMLIDRYVKVNIMDYRATYPKDLLRPGVHPCSPRNAETISGFARGAHAIVVCWGKLHPRLAVHADAVLRLLNGRPLNCLGVNGDGSPKHPLYLAGNTRFERFPRSIVDAGEGERG